MNEFSILAYLKHILLFMRRSFTKPFIQSLRVATPVYECTISKFDARNIYIQEKFRISEQMWWTIGLRRRLLYHRDFYQPDILKMPFFIIFYYHMNDHILVRKEHSILPKQ